jgi:hypothetical protein
MVGMLSTLAEFELTRLKETSGRYRDYWTQIRGREAGTVEDTEKFLAKPKSKDN